MADSDMVEIVPGEYGSNVIANIDNKKREITFADVYGKKGKSFTIPNKADKLWYLLKMLIETASKDGATPMTEEFKNWEGLFYRRETKSGCSKDRKEELAMLKRHIKSCKKPGNRGLDVLKIVAEPIPIKRKKGKNC